MSIGSGRFSVKLLAVAAALSLMGSGVAIADDSNDSEIGVDVSVSSEATIAPGGEVGDTDEVSEAETGESVYGENTDTENADSESVDTENVDSEGVDTESVDSEEILDDTSGAAAKNVIKDANLKKCVNEQLSRSANQAVTAKDLQGLKSLKCNQRKIANIQGLQHATSLEILNLEHNQVSDVSALAKLTKLRHLHLDGNRISNVSPLSKLTELEDLYLRANRISNVSALAKLKNLWSLHLEGNRISDVSPLSKLTLGNLGLGGNRISDVSPLSTLTNLGWLNLTSNRISNVSPLSKLTKLGTLLLGSNRISDVSALGKLTNLNWLVLSDNRISNVSALGKLTKLEDLQLGHNRVSDVSALGKLTNLKYLDLYYNKVSDVSPLGNLPHLWNLGLGYNKVSDVSSLAKLTKLQHLWLEGNRVSDVSALAKLPPTLDALDLSNNGLSDVKMLKPLLAKGKDFHLYVNDNNVTDWRVLTPEKGRVTRFHAKGQRASVRAVVSGTRTTYNVSKVHALRDAPITWRVGKLVPKTKDELGNLVCGYYQEDAGRNHCFVTDWKRTNALSSNKKNKTLTINENLSGVTDLVLYGEWDVKGESDQRGSFVLKPVYSVAVSSMKVSGASKVAAGYSTTLKAAVAPSNATNKKVSWKSSNTKIATVNAKGVVKGVKPGTVTITATAKDGSKKKASKKITVVKPVKVKGVSISGSSKVAAGSKITLKAKINPSNATNKGVTWSSSNKSIATVNAKGVVTGKKAGKTVTITVTTKDGKKKASKKITVTKAEAVQKVYRLYNPVSSEHLFTTDAKEYTILKDKHGWKQEGVAWMSPKSGAGVYRLYNPGLGDHHYTKDKNEAKTLVKKHGWRYDNGGKPLFYSDAKKRVPVYRCYNPGLRVGQHHYTADKREYDALVKKHGWKKESIGWYAIKWR
ncbi:MAG: leucine-rich repeat domain-containing protein [Actinomycetaceae bacterium]|nr:leucine-rich repeat domain-containing protein [Actinomycetaceae bacterium]